MDTGIQERKTLFAETIDELNFGKTKIEIDEKLMELVKAMEDTGRGGKLTVTLKLIPGNKGEVSIEDDVKVDMPRPKRQASLFFTDENSRLIRNDPKQKLMFNEGAAQKAA